MNREELRSRVGPILIKIADLQAEIKRLEQEFADSHCPFKEGDIIRMAGTSSNERYEYVIEELYCTDRGIRSYHAEIKARPLFSSSEKHKTIIEELFPNYYKVGRMDS